MTPCGNTKPEVRVGVQGTPWDHRVRGQSYHDPSARDRAGIQGSLRHGVRGQRGGSQDSLGSQGQSWGWAGVVSQLRLAARAPLPTQH